MPVGEGWKEGWVKGIEKRLPVGENDESCALCEGIDDGVDVLFKFLFCLGYQQSLPPPSLPLVVLRAVSLYAVKSGPMMQALF